MADSSELYAGEEEADDDQNGRLQIHGLVHFLLGSGTDAQMTDQGGHWAMHLEATELWGSGALTDAKAKYEAAIAMCPPDHWAVSIYRTAYAGVLAALGLDREARAQCELALELERVSSDDASPSVAIARCFLGQQCVRARDFSAALDTVLPSIHAGARCEALLRSIEAQALAGLGRLTEARASANAAVALATSDKQREGIKHELSTILPGAGP